MSADKRSVCLMLILCGLTASNAFSDGCLFTDNYGHDVFAPDQKVVISWDGKQETMILSTKVQSSDLASFGWVIPIPSSRKPQVELGDVQVFYDLSDYFNSRRQSPEMLMLSSNGDMSFNSIQVLETKKLDIFDITILKATDSKELYRWLQINSFKIPNAAEGVLAHYTNKDFYFVAVKINLQNEYRADIDRVTKYGLLDLAKAAAAKAPTQDQRMVSGALVGQEDTTYHARNKHFGASVAEHIAFYALLGRPYPQGLNDYISPQEYDQLKAKYAGAQANFERVKPHLSRLCEALVLLRAGVAKPLRISFEPPEPFFPLRISSLNGGNVQVAVYVFDSMPVKDEAGILSIEEWKEVNSRLRATVAKYLKAKNRRCVTKLVFEGPSSQFTDDVRFTRMNDSEKTRFSAEAVAEVRSRPGRLAGAVMHGDLDTVKDLVSLGTRLDAWEGIPLIHLAIRCCRNSQPATKMIEYLLSQGADINERDTLFHRGQAATPLYGAIAQGYWEPKGFEVTEFLIAKGAVLGAERLPRDAGEELLVYAASKGSETVVEFLVNHGVDINGRSTHGRFPDTALAAAVRGGHIEIVRFLLDHGALVDNGPDMWSRETPLHLACEQGQLEIVTLLLDRGATLDNGLSFGYMISAAASGNMALVELLASKGAPIDLPPWHPRESPLSAASRAGHKEVVQFLLAKGVEPNRGGDSPLTVAATAGHEEITKLLELYGALPSRLLRTLRPIEASLFDPLVAGMGKADVTRLLGAPPHMLPTVFPEDRIVCYFRRKEKEPWPRFETVYLILRNDKLIKWGTQPVLAEHVTECLRRGPDANSSNSAHLGIDGD